MTDPRRPEIRDNGVGCGKLAAVLASIVLLFFAALLIVGWIAITNTQSVSDTTTHPAVYPSGVK